MLWRPRTAKWFALLLILSLLFPSFSPSLPIVVAQDAPPAQPAAIDVPAQTGSISGRVTHNGAGLADVTITATRIEPSGTPQVIILPGVMGTELNNEPTCGSRPSGKIWGEIASFGNLTPLFLQSSGSAPLDNCDRIVESGLVDILWVEPYEPFKNQATANGLEVLAYPGYDWRLNLVSQATNLDEWINANADLSRPIYLVAHSMGGLLAREYVSNQTRANKIAGVVTIGTPYLGSPMIAKRMVEGVIGSPLDALLDNDQIRELIRFSPGIFQLMPSPASFVGTSLPYYRTKSGESLTTYASTIAHFIASGRGGQTVIQQSTDFHNRVDGFDNNFFAAGRYTVLYSKDHYTPSIFREKGCWFSSQSICMSIDNYVLGDGTVPANSATLARLNASARSGVSFCGYDSVLLSYKEHMDLLTDSRVIADILHVLKGEPTEHCGSATTLAAGGATAFREIAVWGKGRVLVVDSGDLFTGVDEDGVLQQGLPDVMYMVSDGGVIITLPLAAAYKIEIVLTATEPMQVLASDFGSEGDEHYGVESRTLFDSVSSSIDGKLTLPNAGAPLASLTLTVDANGDGAPEQTLTPDAVLTTPEQAQDYTPPTSGITLNGTKNAQGVYTEPVTVGVNATDTGGSGLLATRYSLNNGATWQEYSAPFQVAVGAAEKVLVFSTDKAGNQEYPPVEQALNFGQEQNKIFLPNVGTGGTQRAVAEAASAQTVEVPLIAPLPQAVVEPAAVDAPDYIATTNANGNYTLASLPAGTYKVTAQRSGYSMTPLEQPAIVTVLPSSTNTNINFTAVEFTPGDTVLIPAGSFTMGCDAAVDPWECGNVGSAAETPYHSVNLNPYRIDKYEVTNARYAECVQNGQCSALQSTQAHDELQDQSYEYYGVPAYANFPVVNVTWHQADEFCRATGGRLPTAAEWERAARGDSDRRVWPWGNTFACSKANVWDDLEWNQCNAGRLTEVGAYPSDASPHEVMDMAGNAHEWVNDWSYREYTENTVSNPTGPESGSSRVLRGGSFREGSGATRVSFRSSNNPDYWFYGIGFRCVRSP